MNLVWCSIVWVAAVGRTPPCKHTCGKWPYLLTRSKPGKCFSFRGKHVDSLALKLYSRPFISSPHFSLQTSTAFYFLTAMYIQWYIVLTTGDVLCCCCDAGNGIVLRSLSVAHFNKSNRESTCFVVHKRNQQILKYITKNPFQYPITVQSWLI